MSTRHKAALIILQGLVELGVKFGNTGEDRLYRIIIESVTGSRRQREDSFRNFGYVFVEINDILAGKVCNVCGDEIDPSDRKGEPVCFHCWLHGKESPMFRERSVHERVG